MCVVCLAIVGVILTIGDGFLGIGRSDRAQDFSLVIGHICRGWIAIGLEDEHDDHDERKDDAAGDEPDQD